MNLDILHNELEKRQKLDTKVELDIQAEISKIKNKIYQDCIDMHEKCVKKGTSN